MSYAAVLHEARIEPATSAGAERQEAKARGAIMRHVAHAYLPTARVWARVFELEAETGWESDAIVLSEVYEHWRRKDGLEATVAWGGWLLKRGKGKEAKEVVVGARSWLGEEERTELERRWAVILDEAVVEN